MKSNDIDSDDIERKVNHKVKKCKAETKQEKTHKKAKKEVTSECSNSNSESESKSDSESTPVKIKKCKLKKAKRPEKMDKSSTESPPDTELDKGVKPHRKLTLHKLTGSTKGA